MQDSNLRHTVQETDPWRSLPPLTVRSRYESAAESPQKSGGIRRRSPALLSRVL